ncbi:hypothetical protein DZE40_003864 [Clostridium beijerinckii]|nr:hypothetical protein [Clostridium beijerinckii]NRY62769.1 hypothetical protein [Clostridium beijerinckii]
MAPTPLAYCPISFSDNFSKNPAAKPSPAPAVS